LLMKLRADSALSREVSDFVRGKTYYSSNKLQK